MDLVGIYPNMNSTQMRSRVIELAQSLDTFLNDYIDSITYAKVAQLQVSLMKAKVYFNTTLQQVDFSSKAENYNAYIQTFQLLKTWLVETLEDLGIELSEEVKARIGANLDEEFNKIQRHFEAETAGFSEEKLRQRIRKDLKETMASIDSAYTFVGLVDLTEVTGTLEIVQDNIDNFIEEVPHDYTFKDYKNTIENLLENFILILALDSKMF